MSSIGINELPANILTSIFRYLEYGDRLEARCVCKIWNSTISKWNGFLKSVSFKIYRSPAYNSYPIIKASTVPWKHIRLSKPSIQKPASWYFPAHLGHSLTSLRLEDTTITWSWFQEIPIIFPKLDKLAIKCPRSVVDKDEGWFQSSEVVYRFTELIERIRYLELDADDASTVGFYLKRFTSPNSKLEALTIKCHPEVSTSATYSAEMYNLISCCARTLKSLVIETNDLLKAHAMNCLEKLTKEPYSRNYLKLTKFKLNINFVPFSVYMSSLLKMSSSSSYFPDVYDDYTIYIDFLTLQSQIEDLFYSQRLFRRINLSTSNPLLSDLEIDCIESWIESLGQAWNLMLSDCENIRTITVHLPSQPDEDFEPSPYEFPLYISDNIYSELSSITIQGKSVYFYPEDLKFHFPNLVKLVLLVPDVSNSTVLQPLLTSNWLQAVVKNHSKLQVLKVSMLSYADSGVSGINPEHSVKLNKCKGIYLRDKFPVPSSAVCGVPLSSLTDLKELSLNCPSSNCESFTDVGIHYGFGFKSLRRLELTTGPEFSDWGLVEIAKLNPCLETCSISTISTNVTPFGITVFKKLLRRAPRDRTSVHIISSGSEVP